MQDTNAIDPTESERIFHRRSHFAIEGFSTANIQIHFGIELIDIDRRMQRAALHLQNCRDRLYRGRRPARMPEHRLRGIEFQPIGVLSERALDRSDFRQIAERRGRGMRIDIIDVFRRQTAFFQNPRHEHRLPLF